MASRSRGFDSPRVHHCWVGHGGRDASLVRTKAGFNSPIQLHASQAFVAMRPICNGVNSVRFRGEAPCGRSSTVECLASTQKMRVRFTPSAPRGCSSVAECFVANEETGVRFSPSAPRRQGRVPLDHRRLAMTRCSRSNVVCKSTQMGCNSPPRLHALDAGPEPALAF